MITSIRSLLAGAALVVAAASSPTAQAHIHLLSPTPRTDADNLKVGPCGGEPRTDNPTVLRPGQTLEVTWEETIDHPGWYRIAFSPADDTGFDSQVLADQIVDVDGGGCYQQTVTLPDTPCDDCTLQLIQVMTDKPQQSGDYQKYYACADLVLDPAAEPGESGSTNEDGPLETCPEGGDDGGGVCALVPTSRPTSLAGFLALSALVGRLLRRRRG